MDYYKIPLKLDQIVRKQDVARCGLKESVAGMIHLIATSNFGECKHDETFGCEIWNHDFENITNAQIFKETVRTSLLEAIGRFEKRIESVHVEIDFEQVLSSIKGRRIKNRILLIVTGKLVMTNEDFVFNEHFYIGPLSYY
jgi:phage baseplate assembly protein W